MMLAKRLEIYRFLDITEVLAPVAQHRTFMRAGLNRSVTRQQVVLYPRSTIFAAVSQVELYQDFLPWCMSSRILDRQPSSYKGTPDSAESLAAVPSYPDVLFSASVDGSLRVPRANDALGRTWTVA